LRENFPLKNQRKTILVSLFAVILVASMFVMIKRSDFLRSTPADSGKPSKRLADAAEQSSSRRGSNVDKLRFKVVNSSIAPPSPPPSPSTPPDEVLDVDGFTSEYVDWDMVGNAPYLYAVGDGDYVQTPYYCNLIGQFTFEHTTLDKIGFVKIEAYAQSEWSEIDGDIYVSTYLKKFEWVGSIEAGTDWGWYFTDGGVINTLLYDKATVNSAMFAIHYWTPDESSGPVMKVDAVRLSLWSKPLPQPPPPASYQIEGMENDAIDTLTDLASAADVERLSSEGFTVTDTPGFHIGFVGFNLKRPYLSDVVIRHALFHGYNQEDITASIYRYTAWPVQSLVPPSQGEWMSTTMMKHPFNPGTASDPPGTESVFGIMKAGGYVYHGTGYGDLNGWWEAPDHNPLPTWHFWTPTYEVAPTSAEHGSRICAEWHKCGFNNIIFEPMDFNTYTHSVYYDHNFDMFMMFFRLDRFPTQLYDWCYSGEYYPGSSQAVGLNDPTLDQYVTTFKYNLGHTAAVNAAHAAQDYLYNPSHAQALCYMCLYSRVYFNAFNPGLRGIVNSPGYGSNNVWTLMNMRWEPGHPYERIESGNSTVIWCIGEEPGTLNYLAGSTAYEADIIGPTQDSGIAVNPYTHGDIAWQDSQLPTVVGPITMTTPHGVKIVNGMSATYHIRDDIYWQDGNKYDADDAIFSLNFLKNNQIPANYDAWKDIVDIYKVDQLTYTVYANITSPFVHYNWDRAAYICPPQVWNWLDGKPLATILAYDPTANTTDTGPWSYPLTPNGPKTLLFGTGPFVFDGYNKTGMFADLHNWDANGINLGYFKTTEQTHAQLTEMFHFVGDVNRDGVVDQIDKDRCFAALGSQPGDPNWDPDCDLTGDGRVDGEDEAMIGAFWGKGREYPLEFIDVAVLDVTAFPTVVYPGQKINLTVTAKNKGNAGFTTNFTYYYDNNFIINQTVKNLLPHQAKNINYLWDTTGVSPGVYTISVTATVLDGVDINLTDNTFTSGKVKIGTTKIGVDPEKSVVGSTGKEFSINVTITDAPYNATWAWEFKLNWTASILKITDIKEGPFLNQSGRWATAFLNVTNQVQGWVLSSCTLVDDPIKHWKPLPSGNGTLATIKFNVLNIGNSALHLYDTTLLNYDVDPYYHTTQDGEFKVLLGDINRDGIVDKKDLEIVTMAYGSAAGDPNWNPEADIWGPNDKPDGLINVYDLAMWGRKYGGKA
jgi:ABC-type transport system substrate-binding protein